MAATCRPTGRRGRPGRRPGRRHSPGRGAIQRHDRGMPRGHANPPGMEASPPAAARRLAGQVDPVAGTVDPAPVAHPPATVAGGARHGPAGIACGRSGPAWADADGGANPSVRTAMNCARPPAIPIDLVIDVIGWPVRPDPVRPKVPPQMARQIARLQLPVLRAALATRASSRRAAPVRRFINRIASLGNGSTTSTTRGPASWPKVRELVHEIVEGDFEQIGPTGPAVRAGEFVAAGPARSGQTARRRRGCWPGGRPDACGCSQRLQRLEGDVAACDGAGIPCASSSPGLEPGADAAERRTERRQRALTCAARAGRELIMSVQPKTTPAQRKAFPRRAAQADAGPQRGMT